ncbi:MAG TPA: hypothetical protein VJ739_11680, partial [Gemmataceae bacterium]|nr:hypothetical protein [Gemmataceae bacterium]
LFSEIDGPAAGTGYAQLRVAGTVSLNGPLLRLALGFAPAPGQDFVLIANDGPGTVGGTFAGAPEDALLAHGGQFFDISYAGGRGRDVDLLSQSRGDLFVRGLFADFSAPSTRGTRAPFEAQVDGGQARLIVAQNFLTSPARFLGEVNLFYAVFGQPHDGLEGVYLRQLLSGVPAGQVLVNFLTSRSFRRRHAGNTAFAKALFTALLGHAPGKHDRLGHHTLAFYVQELNSGAVSRAGLVRQLLASDEVYAAAVTQNFETLLGTVPTPAQRQALNGQLFSGGLTPNALSGLLVTQEAYVDFFLARAAAGRVPGVVLTNV